MAWRPVVKIYNPQRRFHFPFCPSSVCFSLFHPTVISVTSIRRNHVMDFFGRFLFLFLFFFSLVLHSSPFNLNPAWLAARPSSEAPILLAPLPSSRPCPRTQVPLPLARVAVACLRLDRLLRDAVIVLKDAKAPGAFLSEPAGALLGQHIARGGVDAAGERRRRTRRYHLCPAWRLNVH